MTKHWVEEIFEKCGAIIEGHFVLSSWRHSNKYLDKRLIYPDTKIVSHLCKRLAEDIGMTNNILSEPIDVIVGPALGGIPLAQWTAYHLNNYYHGGNILWAPTGHRVIALFTEKKNGRQVLKEAYRKLVTGKRVYIVDDILSTGGSVREVMGEVESARGMVKGIAVICNRGGITPAMLPGYHFALWEIKIEDWEESVCPLCEAGVPINTEYGKGKEWLARKANQNK